MEVALTKDALLVITIRPIEYWNDIHQRLSPEDLAALNTAHVERGFAFWPHRKREAIQGDITYGDTSMSLGYIGDHFPKWRLEYAELNVDPLQVLVFLRPA